MSVIRSIMYYTIVSITIQLSAHMRHYIQTAAAVKPRSLERPPIADDSVADRSEVL